ncbi:hypothetical protein JX265_014022 [Neoarthrinium moseri]|uniref:Aminotransferase n=1 Tax=Neoarthrinium moseri TaxID=1658444 RepID=A0A9P9W7F9_9PEZI|nr:hypothetical protein JX265_014022 [Neoarthrinium moseri]
MAQALGCVPSVPGYFKAMKQVCEKHGALLILDEVMCGMGRTGSLHAWQQEDVVPDIQTIGKAFVHGHTYQGHPVACAAALEVQKIISQDHLLENVREMGKLLSEGLIRRLSSHPNVGNIRGRGLFWGIEFVSEQSTKKSFPNEAGVAMGIAELGLTESYGIAVYPGTGTVDGISGDHVIVSPPYNTTADEIEEIMSIIERLVNDYFKEKKVAC